MAVPWLRRLVAGLSMRKAQVHARISPQEIYGGQCSTGLVSPSSSLFPYHRSSLHTHRIHHLEYEQQRRWWKQFSDHWNEQLLQQRVRFKFSRRRVWSSELSSGKGWWRQYVPLKRRSTIILHGSTSQKTILNFIATTLTKRCHKTLSGNTALHLRCIQTYNIVIPNELYLWNSLFKDAVAYWSSEASTLGR
jgi:hypothetical protein